MRDQSGSQHRLGSRSNCLQILDDFDAARLASAAGVNLRLDHPQGPARKPLAAGFPGRVRLESATLPLGIGMAYWANKFLRLIFVQVHELSLSTDLVA